MGQVSLLATTSCRNFQLLQLHVQADFTGLLSSRPAHAARLTFNVLVINGLVSILTTPSGWCTKLHQPSHKAAITLRLLPTNQHLKNLGGLGHDDHKESLVMNDLDIMLAMMDRHNFWK